MEIMEPIRAAIKELILPDLNHIREENREIKAILVLTNKRLDDINLHLADQSRRIDETNRRIDDTNKRIDDINKRFDDVYKHFDDVNKHFDDVNKRFDDVNKRFDSLRNELILRTDALQNDLIQRTGALHDELIRHTDAIREEIGNQIMAINTRLDRLYEVIVRRDEHQQLETRLFAMERDITELKSRLSVKFQQPRDLAAGSVAEGKP